MPIEHIRLSQQAKDQLTRLKRSTGLKHWNELCRWAFCLSLADPTIPAQAKIPTDSSIEMTWKIFAGHHQEIYWALLKVRCEQDGLGTSEDVLTTQFKLHLHRGIGFLAADRQLKTISDLLKKAQTVSFELT